MKNLNKKNKRLTGLAVLLVVFIAVLYFIVPAALADNGSLENYGLDAASGFGLGSAGLVETIGNIIKIFLGLLGILAVLLVCYGGYLWMTASGDSAQIEKAKKIIIAAVIGLVIIFSAFAIASFVINQISNATGADGGDGGGGTNPPTPWELNNKYSYIGGVKDETIGEDGWSRSIGWNYAGDLSIPASAGLETKGYAKDTNNTIGTMEFHATPDSGSGFSLISNFNIPTDRNVIIDVYAPWDTSALNVGANPLAKIMVSAASDSFESKAVSTIVRPIHCFNNIQDVASGETGIDCGGECGACAGAPCDADTATPVCDADNSVCANGVCDIDAGCVCAQLPEILYISPASDPNNDTNYDDPSTWDDDVANGAPGNYITIWGRYFGDEPGEVRFNDQLADLTLKDGCDDTWNYYQIVVEVPNLSAGDYNVQVFNEYGLGSNAKIFTINNINRPGICSAYNLTKYNSSAIKVSSGKDGEEVAAIGNSFPTADAAGDFFWYFSTRTFDNASQTWSYNLVEHNNQNTVWNWDGDNNAKDYVPTNRRSRSSIRVYNIGSSQYSNYFKFLVSPGAAGDPCGYDSGLCSLDFDTCQEGLSCSGETCACQETPNICGDNLLGSQESCDIINGSYRFHENKALCSDYNLGAGQVSCTNNCQLDISKCEFSGELAAPASQSIYTWYFFTGYDDDPQPYVIEDCSRNRECSVGAKLPSPTPWSEGWNKQNYPYYDIDNPLSCLDVIVSARFNVQMDPKTINSDNIKVLKCDNIEGSNCIEVAGNLRLVSDNSGKEDDYFRFSPANPLSPNSWYKVVLRNGLNSLTGKSFRFNESDAEKVDHRHCQIAGVNGGSYNITDSVYCWNFQTRSSNDCEPGCAECSPDPHTMYWPLSTTGYLADIDSDDNVCLLLDPADYSWNWSTDKSAKLGINESNESATAVAIGETIYDKPNPYASLFAEMVGYGKKDFCRAYNDFTNPIVMEDASCSSGNIQSPTPWKDSRDACVNAMISARFSRNMADTTINYSNILVKKCNQGQGSAFDKSACEEVAYDDLRIFDYSHEWSEITQSYLTSEEMQNLISDLPEGFIVSPAGGNLEANTWYQVVILGGENGVRGATKNEDPEGRLEKPNCDGDGDGSFDDYCWKFQTSRENCDINSVNVAPRNLFMRYTDSSQVYNAFPQAANCNLLNPYSYIWNWRSLISLNDDVGENDSAGGSGISVASICSESASSCQIDDYSSDLTSPKVKVFAQAEGETNIKARAVNTRDVDCSWNDATCGDKWNYGKLQVGFGDLRVIDYSPSNTKCSDAAISISFNIDADVATIKPNDNLLLYKVGSFENGSESLVLQELREDIYPDFNYSSSVKISPAATLSTGTYRVVLKGGTKENGGVIAWNGKRLADLNYNTSSDGAAEECEPELYPWNQKSGTCSSASCLLIGNLCGTDSAECVAGSIDCDNECHNLGNNNVASCGNKVVEKGEDCDDGNINNNDGCSSECLWEGSNQRWGSLCLNGVKEYGEECDFGSQQENEAKGCNSSCLFETDPEGDAGSQPSMSVCGNNRIEAGEDCDDGNTSSGDGCKGTETGRGCLNEGSDKCSLTNKSDCCGNKQLETGQPDSFSWTFDVDQREEVCYPGATIDINPCPNAIWRVIFPQGIGTAKVTIQQGSNSESNPDTTKCVAASGPQSFWQSAVKKIKIAIKKAFGQTVSAANYWCAVSEKNYNFDNFDNVHIDADGFEMIGYKNENQAAIVNYIKDESWSLGGEYRIVVDYDNYGLSTKTITKTLTVFSPSSGYLNSDGNCALTGEIVNIWPVGEEKYTDNFFCDGDDCGQDDYDRYLKDQSPAAGNNHLYRAWAINDKIESNKKYLIKPQEGFIWQIAATIPSGRLNLSNSAVSDTAYLGDQWLTLAKSDLDIYDASGWASLRVVAAENSDNYTEKDIDINVFLCDNPWPYPAFFPFVDQANNCTYYNGGTCLNTNFKTYYCRDKGESGPYDDLPAIGNFDYVNEKMDISVVGLKKNILKEFFFPRLSPEKLKDDANFMDGNILGSGRLMLVDGKVGKAGKFNLGVGEAAIEVPGFWNYIDSDEGKVDNYDEPITISAWVKAGAADRADFWVDGNFNEGSAYYDRTTGQFMMSMHNVGASFSVAPEDFDNWHFIAMSVPGFDHVGETASFYFDDKLQTKIQVARNDEISSGPEDSLHLGYNLGAGIFDGAIDELKIHKAILSKDEIYNGSSRGLVAYYSFDNLYGQTDNSSDTIGIRVAQNNYHYSPALWYFGNFDTNQQGNPKESVVDNYPAIEEGRTTYVDAADLNNNREKIFTDIYLVSYSEGADNVTKEIYSLLVKYLGFNFGHSGEEDGGLMATGVCSGNANIICRTDRDCQAENFGYCDSTKAKLTRDTVRLADIQDANYLLETYKSKKRCSNDQSVSCSNNSQCYGGGSCGEYYPILKSGSYVVGRSFSVWPSWQETLAKFLGSVLPTDPLNQLIGCSSPYDAVTCWNEVTKSMQCPTGANIYSYYDKNQAGTYSGFKTINEYSNDWDNDFDIFTDLSLFNFINSETCHP